MDTSSHITIRALLQAWQQEDMDLQGIAAVPKSMAQNYHSQGMDFHSGKVRDCFMDPHKTQIIIYHSDRLSAHDRHVGIVPYRGVMLAALTHYWLKKIAPIMPQYMTDYNGERIIFGHLGKPLAVEVIIRGYVAGSMWRDLQKGYFAPYLNATVTEEVLKKAKPYQKLPCPIVHLTTKSKDGDCVITSADAINEGRLSDQEWQHIQKDALQLYQLGMKEYQRHGWILADTKCEFARSSHHSTPLLIDEVLTPDASRLWSYTNTNTAHTAKPISWDKDIIREYLRKKSQHHHDNNSLPKQHIITLAQRYLDVCETLLAKPLYVKNPLYDANLNTT
ncbi:MAG: hypothetical protein OXC44_02155 [Proteobacteria bacterium]|nr:hypothetical protein [Pseudomonadota bacterium]